MLSLWSTHQLADLMELVRQEISVDVDSAAQDAAKQMKKVLASVNDIDNFNTSAFLTTTGKEVQPTSEQLLDRPT